MYFRQEKSTFFTVVLTFQRPLSAMFTKCNLTTMTQCLSKRYSNNHLKYSKYLWLKQMQRHAGFSVIQLWSLCSNENTLLNLEKVTVTFISNDCKILTPY